MKNKGFTLIEILVAVLILGVFLGGLSVLSRTTFLFAQSAARKIIAKDRAMVAMKVIQMEISKASGAVFPSLAGVVSTLVLDRDGFAWNGSAETQLGVSQIEGTIDSNVRICRDNSNNLRLIKSAGAGAANNSCPSQGEILATNVAVVQFIRSSYNHVQVSLTVQEGFAAGGLQPVPVTFQGAYNLRASHGE